MFLSVAAEAAYRLVRQEWKNFGHVTPRLLDLEAAAKAVDPQYVSVRPESWPPAVLWTPVRVSS